MLVRSRLLLLVGLATVPLAIVLHLVAEAAALGTQSLTLPFLERHLYLIFIGCASMAAALRIGNTSLQPGHGLRSIAVLLALSYRGKGHRLFAFTWIFQFAFLSITMTFERLPAYGENWFVGGMVAIMLATLMSWLLFAVPRRILETSASSYRHRNRSVHGRNLPIGDVPVSRRPLLDTGYQTTIGNRPPPHAA